MKLKRSKITTKIIVFALAIYAAITLISLQALSEEAKLINSNLEREVVEIEIQNANLEYAIENHDDPDVIADIARSYLGLGLPGEVVVYDNPADHEETD